MNHRAKDTPITGSDHGTLSSYSNGFLLSIILTLEAYFFVRNDLLQGAQLVYALLTLACVQLFVQMMFFLHIGKGTPGRWKWAAFAMMLVVVFILVVGSLWIMGHLNYHTDMSPSQTDTHIIQDEGFKR